MSALSDGEVHGRGASAGDEDHERRVVVSELVGGDVFPGRALMAGALLDSLPVAVFYSFFVEYYVSGMTGAVKE